MMSRERNAGLDLHDDPTPCLPEAIGVGRLETHPQSLHALVHGTLGRAAEPARARKVLGGWHGRTQRFVQAFQAAAAANASGSCFGVFFWFFLRLRRGGVYVGCTFGRLARPVDAQDNADDTSRSVRARSSPENWKFTFTV